jgi:hypothetical protein
MHLSRALIRCICLFGVMLTIAACVPRVAPPTQAVILVTATPGPTVTLAPSPTPLTRRTLPPTWTPSVFTATPDLVALPREATNVPEVCSEFSLDFNQNLPSFTLGFEPIIYWFRALGAPLYRVRLYDPSGALIFADDTASDSYTFGADLFTLTETYAWEVIPMDEARNQLCQAIGSILVGTFAAGAPDGT